MFTVKANILLPLLLLNDVLHTFLNFKILMPCWLAGCVSFFFLKEMMKTSPNHVTIPKHHQAIRPRYPDTQITHYTHPLLSRGYPAQTNPFLFFLLLLSLLLFFSFASSVPRSFQPTQHSPF